MSSVKFQATAVKVQKYAETESGDTIEMVERPHGGLSFVLADGQRSGRSAKLISNLVARKAIALLGEGVRDGAAARAAHDYLRTHRTGQVSADLIILSLDLESHTVVVSRNGPPVLVVAESGSRVLEEACEPIGIHNATKPTIVEIPLQAGLRVAVFSDGLLDAGARYGEALPVGEWLALMAAWAPLPVADVADRLLDRALELDRERPQDDTSVLVVGVYAGPQERVQRRRLAVEVPLENAGLQQVT